jgi:serine/threonine protein kinase
MTHPLSRDLCRPVVGQRFHVAGDEYELGGVVGDGAVGIVRKATRCRDGLTRAVKFLAPDPKYIDEAVFDDVAARFTREGERGSKLDFPSLLKVHRYVENKVGGAFAKGSPQNPFLLMEFVGGRTLESHIHRLPKDDPRSFVVSVQKLDIALQLVDGLEYLHKKKLVHRDVKPANVFLTKPISADGRVIVKLGDFGIVKWGDFHASLSTGVLTATNQRGLGTLKYMAPEQAIAPKNVGVKSDIFSLGITLFELFAERILASPHHVYEITLARLTRGSTLSRFASMNYSLQLQDQEVGKLLLDMHLRGISGRPSIENVRGVLRRAYESVTGGEWQAP